VAASLRPDDVLNAKWPTTIRQHFLTLCAGVDYTNKFKTSLERGLSDALKNRRDARNRGSRLQMTTFASRLQQ